MYFLQYPTQQNTYIQNTEEGTKVQDSSAAKLRLPSYLQLYNVGRIVIYNSSHQRQKNSYVGFHRFDE